MNMYSIYIDMRWLKYLTTKNSLVTWSLWYDQIYYNFDSLLDFKIPKKIPKSLLFDIGIACVQYTVYISLYIFLKTSL